MSVVDVAVDHVDDVPPVPPLVVQDVLMKRYSIGGVASDADDVADIVTDEVAPASSGNVPKDIGLGVGAEVSPALVVPLPALESAVTSESWFLALTLNVYVVEALRFEIVRASSVASDIQTSLELVPLPDELTQKPVHLGSDGEVEETYTENCVVGDDAGLPFSAFVRARVDVEGLASVGAPGIAAAVYTDELADAVPVFGVPTESLACI